jgi:hypothetical protein
MIDFLERRLQLRFLLPLEARYPISMAKLICVFLLALSAQTPVTTAALSNAPWKTLISQSVGNLATATVASYLSATELNPHSPPEPQSPPTYLSQSQYPASYLATLWGTLPAASLFPPAMTLQDLKR